MCFLCGISTQWVHILLCCCFYRFFGGAIEMTLSNKLGKDVEIKHLLKKALTSRITSRAVYMKGVDSSYAYEGYADYMIEEV